MTLWQDLTLQEQLRWAGWQYQPGNRTNPPAAVCRETGERIEAYRLGRGWTGLTSRWVRWQADHLDELAAVVEAYNASLEPIRWYPRPGDWLVYSRTHERTNTYRLDCTGQTVQMVRVLAELLEDDSTRTAYQVTGVWAGYGYPQRVCWSAYPGELRPATPSEQRAAQHRLAELGL